MVRRRHFEMRLWERTIEKGFLCLVVRLGLALFGLSDFALGLCLAAAIAEVETQS